MMTNAELLELLTTTPAGPWEYEQEPGCGFLVYRPGKIITGMALAFDEESARFIVAAREALPRLIAANERLEKMRAAAERCNQEPIVVTDWGMQESGCAYCGAEKAWKKKLKHKDGCPWAELRAALKEQTP